jgi:ribonucleoside-diphosphate reductase alpha chain
MVSQEVYPKYVIKRNGASQEVSYDKVLARIVSLASRKPVLHVDVHTVAQRVIARIVDGIRTTDLDLFAARYCSSLVSEHPDYSILAARIAVSNHHKNTPSSFSECMELLSESIHLSPKL